MESSDKHITVYTVGYPSTAYYPDGYDYSFNIFTYPGPGGNWPMPPEFTEGTAEYLYQINTDPSTPDENWHDTHAKIYNLMSYTPPYGYILDKNGNYTYTAEAKIYSCNLDVKYGGITNSINGGTDTMHKVFRYKKKINPNDYKIYYVTFTLNGTTLNCFCKRITFIPGTNNGNVTLGINIQLGDGRHSDSIRSFNFEWKMKDGINQNKYCNAPYYLGSGFTTRSDWEATRSDGSKVHFSFQIDRSSIPYPPHG